MSTSRWILAGLLAAVAGCATESARIAATDADYGVLVMAHGGSRQWDAAVLSAVAPLRRGSRSQWPWHGRRGITAGGRRKFESRGVREIGVVRLFVSGDSFPIERSRFWVCAPALVEARRGSGPGRSRSARHGPWEDRHELRVRGERRGPQRSPRDGRNPARPRPRVEPRSGARRRPRARPRADDAENERWLAYMDRLAEQTRSTLPFHRVQVATLREDWPEKRVEAQRAVRRFVENSRRRAAARSCSRCASKDSVRTRRCSKGSTTRPTSSACSRTAMYSLDSAASNRASLSRFLPRSYTARSAVATGSRAARTAGNNPPRNPTRHAQPTPIASSVGVTCISKTSELTPLPSATVLPLNSAHEIAAPSSAPSSASARDSTSTDTTTPPAPKPIARSVAISTARDADGRVHRVQGGEQRPECHDAADEVRDDREKRGRLSRLALVVVRLSLDRDGQCRVGRERRLEFVERGFATRAAR